jgi:hypothetical protein
MDRVVSGTEVSETAGQIYMDKAVDIHRPYLSFALAASYIMWNVTVNAARSESWP